MNKVEEIKRLKTKIRFLKWENNCLERLLGDCEGEWDLEGVYFDILLGRFNGVLDKSIKPNKRMALWFAKRHELDLEGCE